MGTSFLVWRNLELFGFQSESAEGSYGEVLIQSLEVLGNGLLLVNDVLLVQEAALIVELLHTTLSDALNHVLGLALLASLIGSDLLLTCHDVSGNLLGLNGDRILSGNLQSDLMNILLV